MNEGGGRMGGRGQKRDFNVMISISRVICYVYKNVNTRLAAYVGYGLRLKRKQANGI